MLGAVRRSSARRPVRSRPSSNESPRLQHRGIAQRSGPGERPRRAGRSRRAPERRHGAAADARRVSRRSSITRSRLRCRSAPLQRTDGDREDGEEPEAESTSHSDGGRGAALRAARTEQARRIQRFRAGPALDRARHPIRPAGRGTADHRPRARARQGACGVSVRSFRRLRVSALNVSGELGETAHRALRGPPGGESGAEARYLPAASLLGRRVLILALLQHLHRFVDRGLQLAVDALQLVLRRVLDPHVRRHAVVLEVDAVVVRLRSGRRSRRASPACGSRRR